MFSQTNMRRNLQSADTHHQELNQQLLKMLLEQVLQLRIKKLIHSNGQLVKLLIK
jgi:hypothetical protein